MNVKKVLDTSCTIKPNFTAVKVEEEQKYDKQENNKLLIGSLAALATIATIGLCYHNKSKILSILKKTEKPNPSTGTPHSASNITTSTKSKITQSEYDDVIIEGVSETTTKTTTKTGLSNNTCENFDDVIIENGAKIESTKSSYQRPPSKVWYRKGIAIDPVKIKRYTGTIEETSSQGHKLTTVYKDGLITERTFIPASGNIKRINKTYNYTEPFKEIVTRTVTKDGQVSYKYHADFLDFPRIPKEYQSFWNVEFGETISQPSKIHKYGNKKVYRYTDGYTIEQIDNDDVKTIKLLLEDGSEVARRNIFKSGVEAIAINKNGTFYSIAHDKNGNFKWANTMTTAKNGNKTVFARKANGTGSIVERNSADEIISKNENNLYNLLTPPPKNIENYNCEILKQ